MAHGSGSSIRRGFDIVDQCLIGQLSSPGRVEGLTPDVPFDPQPLGYIGNSFVTEAPHGVEKVLRQTDLDSLRLDAVVQQGEQVGYGLIRPIGC